jgi:dTDP-4-amino-4,6-dideoxygalactose transaminase
MEAVGERLALLGGEPVRQRPWPAWPRADKNTERLILDVLYSQRWAISGLYNGRKSYERQFAEAFAAYHGVPYCVPAANGSSALAMALEAVGVRYGDEVIVPGLTWVACASSVVGIGAIPVLADVEAETLCLSVDATRRAITSRTRAIMLVHLYCAVANLDAFVALSEETGIPLVEDCSQAHGAVWKGRRVGTFGKVGVFSMQDSKVLTSGEGGAAVTSDAVLYDLMQQSRADGRRYLGAPPLPGHSEMEEVGSIGGYNRCLSEFHAAILLDRLQHLDEENRLRERNANYLRRLLLEIGDVTPLFRRPEINELTYYQFCVRLDLEAFSDAGIEAIRRAAMAELNIYLKPIDMPLNNHILYNPGQFPRVNRESDQMEQLCPRRFDLTNATEAAQQCLLLPHKVLLGDTRDVEEVAAALAKIKRHSKSLLLKSGVGQLGT